MSCSVLRKTISYGSLNRQKPAQKSTLLLYALAQQDAGKNRVEAKGKSVVLGTKGKVTNNKGEKNLVNLQGLGPGVLGNIKLLTDKINLQSGENHVTCLDSLQ